MIGRSGSIGDVGLMSGMTADWLSKIHLKICERCEVDEQADGRNAKGSPPMRNTVEIDCEGVPVETQPLRSLVDVSTHQARGPNTLKRTITVPRTALKRQWSLRRTQLQLFYVEKIRACRLPSSLNNHLMTNSTIVCAGSALNLESSTLSRLAWLGTK